MKSSLRLALLTFVPLWAFPTFAADSTVTAMPAAGALTGPELFYCIQGGVDSKCTAAQVQTFVGPAGANLTLQYNNAGVLGGMSGTSWDDTNRSLTITGATLAGASAPLIFGTQTWNNAATTYEAFRLDVTDTASGGSSSVLNFRVNANVTHQFTKLGGINIRNNYGFLQDTGLLRFGASADASIGRNAANSIRLGTADANPPAAQTFGVQSATGSNISGANWTVRGSTSTGSGTAGDVLIQTGGTGAGAAVQNSFVTALTVKGATQHIIAAKSVQTTCTTVAGLGAAGTAGRNWCVTDQLTACPILGGTFTGGGTVVCKAFDDGTNWILQ